MPQAIFVSRVITHCAEILEVNGKSMKKETGPYRSFLYWGNILGYLNILSIIFILCLYIFCFALKTL